MHLGSVTSLLFRVMSLGAVAHRMVTCLLNISEARNRDIVDKVARAAVFHKHGEFIAMEDCDLKVKIYLLLNSIFLF